MNKQKAQDFATQMLAKYGNSSETKRKIIGSIAAKVAGKYANGTPDMVIGRTLGYDYGKLDYAAAKGHHFSDEQFFLMVERLCEFAPDLRTMRPNVTPET